MDSEDFRSMQSPQVDKKEEKKAAPVESEEEHYSSVEEDMN